LWGKTLIALVDRNPTNLQSQPLYMTLQIFRRIIKGVSSTNKTDNHDIYITDITENGVKKP
jgi:hypothetical protein